MVRDSFILHFRIYINLFRINELIFLIIKYYKTPYYQPYRFIGWHCAFRLNVPLLKRFCSNMPGLKICNSLPIKYFCSPRTRRPFILKTDVSVPDSCSSKNKSISIITQVDRIKLGLTNVVSLQLHNPEAISPIPIFLPSTPSPFDSLFLLSMRLLDHFLQRQFFCR